MHLVTILPSEIIAEFRASLPEIIEGRDPISGMPIDDIRRRILRYGIGYRPELENCNVPNSSHVDVYNSRNERRSSDRRAD